MSAHSWNPSAGSPLTAPSVVALLRALELLYQPVEAEAFPARVLDVMRLVLPDTMGAINFIDLETQAVSSAFDRMASIPDALAAAERHLLDNPLARFLAAGGKAEVMNLDDFTSRREFQRTALFNEAFRPYGMESQLAIVLEQPGFAGGASFHRPGREAVFTEEERRLCLALRPHLLGAHANARLLSALRAQVGQVPVAPVIDAAAMARRGLTPRESEVLRWLAEGKRDGEIAVILAISERTVHTHVAHILAKLGTETRGAAVAAALRPEHRPRVAFRAPGGRRDGAGKAAR